MDIAHDDGFRVELRRMPHEANMWHAGEDWAGITNQKERKRLQNRLNKRVCEFDPPPVPHRSSAATDC